MQISFGNYFKIYNTDINKTLVQDYIASRVKKEGADVKRDEFCFQNIACGAPFKPQKVDGVDNVFLVDTFNIQAKPELDSFVRNTCLANNIPYEELTPEEMLQPENILKRIVATPPKPMDLELHEMVMVDIKKLHALCQEDRVNKDKALWNYSDAQRRYDRFWQNSEKGMDIIKSGKRIQAPTMAIFLADRETLDYDKLAQGDEAEFEKLGKTKFSVCMKNETMDLDMAYFAMLDLGVDRIPVAVDEETKEKMQYLGLLIE